MNKTELTNRKLIPVEKVLLAYLSFTALLILFFWTRLEKPSMHLIIRVIIAFAYLLIVAWSKMIPKVIRIFLPFLLLPFLYGETDFFNNIFFKDLDPIFSQMEMSIFGAQPSLIFSEELPYRWFAELMYFGYFSYYLMVMGLTIYVYVHSNIETTERMGFTIISSFILYYLIFNFLPVTGPQFYFAHQLAPLPEGYIFGPAIKLAQQIGEKPTAAFPSSHVAICLMLIWMSYSISKRIFVLLLAIGIVLMFSTVYIRAHYLIDVFAAIISSPFIYFLAEQMFKKLSLPAEKIANYGT